MGEPLYCVNEDPELFSVTYYPENDAARQETLEAGWKTFNRTDPATGRTFKIWCRPTNSRLEISLQHHMPPRAVSGRYRIETFVPAKHSNSRKVIFSIANDLRSDSGKIVVEEKVAVLDMADLNDVWQSLGEFNLDPGLSPDFGRVRQYDLSLEDPPVESSYGPVRWVPLFQTSAEGRRCDSPVGTMEERDASFPSPRVAFGKYPVWAGEWFDFNPFLTWYTYGYHTGADLNLPGTSDSDKGKPIYAVADGIVTYAGKAGTWGSIVVIEHEGLMVRLPDGNVQQQRVYSRYGHVEADIPIRVGQEIERGQEIAAIGLAAGAVSGWHLHFDICYSGLLKSRPAHWPNLKTVRRAQYMGRDSRGFNSSKAAVMREVVNNYLDPLQFIKDNHGF